MIPTISNECSQFLKESNGQYLVKNLPKKYQGFAKVKVRLRKQKTGFGENLNKAFEDEKSHLHQRSVFAYTDTSMLSDTPDTEPFYIFPIDGYSVMFNPVIKDAEKDYNQYNELKIDNEIISDQLKISYQTGSISEAINSSCEIIIYGIPYYYALRVSLVEDYNLFFNNKR